MKILLLCEHPDTCGSMSTQGNLLFRGLQELGVDVRACHYQYRQKEKEWYYRSFRPDVVLGIGWWVDTPEIVINPKKFGLLPVPWLLADGWVANYHDIIGSLPLVLTTSQWVTDTYKRDGVDVKNFEVLHVGIDDKLFHPIPKTDPGVIEMKKWFGIEGDAKVIATIGGDVTSKGAQEVVRALAKVDKEFKNWVYVCKSSESDCARDHHKEELALMKEVGIDPQKVIYNEDDFTRETMPYLLSMCDVYAAPSRLEGFGMIQVEAMACGIPVVSIDAMGPKDTIIHGETGFLAEVGVTVDLSSELVSDEMGLSGVERIYFDKPKTFAYRADPDDLAKYILQLFTNDDFRKTMGEKAAKHALANFQYKFLAQRCLDILKRKLDLQ